MNCMRMRKKLHIIKFWNFYLSSLIKKILSLIFSHFYPYRSQLRGLKIHKILRNKDFIVFQHIDSIILASHSLTLPFFLIFLLFSSLSTTKTSSTTAAADWRQSNTTFFFNQKVLNFVINSLDMAHKIVIFISWDVSEQTNKSLHRCRQTLHMHAFSSYDATIDTKDFFYL